MRGGPGLTFQPIPALVIERTRASGTFDQRAVGASVPAAPPDVRQDKSELALRSRLRRPM